MAKKIRAKFAVTNIDKPQDQDVTRVTLHPVVTGSEENKAFWDATPNGKIEMYITNKDAKFEFGEYFVDFTPVE